MEITVDTTPLLTRRFGIGYYIENLVRALAGSDTDAEFRLLYQLLRKKDKELFLPDSPNFSALIRRTPLSFSDRIFQKYGIRGDDFCGYPDIFHATGTFLPRFRNSRSVWTCYDLSFLVNPDWFDENTARGLAERARRCVDRADHIITISEHTRGDVIRFFDIDPASVTAIPLAAIPLPEPATTGTNTPEIPIPFILYVGTIEPRKNITRLVEAFSEADLPHHLVLAGAKGWKSKPVYEAIAKSSKREKIHCIDYVSGSDLRVLYEQADFLAYPSLYEGFGLPVLEAMTHGCPVLTSNVSSLPEVGGDAAVMVSPDVPSEIRTALERLAHDEDLRKTLKEKGLRHAERFSWNATAQKTMSVYRRVFGTSD